MPTLTYSNSAFVTLTKISSAVMNAYFTDITTWANTTKLDYLNIQNQGIRVVNISSQAATSTQVMQADGAGAAAWVTRGTRNTVAKTTTYTATVTDEIITCSGTSFTITLPAANASGGKVPLTIKKTDSSLANIFTITRAGSDTIDGASSVTLNTQYEYYTLVSDGSATWNIVAHSYPSIWTSFTTAITGVSANPTYVVNENACWWRRTGDSIHITILHGVTSQSGQGTGNYNFNIPSNITIDTGKLAASSDPNLATNIGIGTAWNNSIKLAGWAYTYDSSHISMVVGDATNTIANVSATYIPVATSVRYMFNCTVPVSGWTG